MSDRAHLLIASIILTGVAVGHVMRAVIGLDLVIGGWSAPMWASWFAAVVFGWFGVDGLRRVLKTG